MLFFLKHVIIFLSGFFSKVCIVGVNFFKLLLLSIFFFTICFCNTLCDKNFDTSVYNLNSTFFNQFGSKVQLKDVKGSIKVVSMIYTRCKTTCPVIVENMKKIFNSLDSVSKDNVHFVLISLDKDRDSIQNLFEYGVNKNLNFEYWSLLTGITAEDVLQLAVSLGVKYKKEVDNTYLHSNLILILDDNGNIRYIHPGLNSDISKVLEILYSIKKV